ncbi:hypothetical protein A2U01_0052543, partial [Trifolium medium]|nr:hypothetical protein [Trifolium medium]
MLVVRRVALAFRITSVRICNDGVRFGVSWIRHFWFRSGSTGTTTVWWCRRLFCGGEK